MQDVSGRGSCWGHGPVFERAYVSRTPQADLCRDADRADRSAVALDWLAFGGQLYYPC